MKTRISAVVLAGLIALSGAGYAASAAADNVTIVGTISKLKLAADGKSATAVLKNVKSGEDVTINITDDLTLDKFKDKRIVEGDEIRTKYDNGGGKNHSKSFKKTAGC